MTATVDASVTSKKFLRKPITTTTVLTVTRGYGCLWYVCSTGEEAFHLMIEKAARVFEASVESNVWDYMEKKESK